MLASEFLMLDNIREEMWNIGYHKKTHFWKMGLCQNNFSYISTQVEIERRRIDGGY